MPSPEASRRNIAKATEASRKVSKLRMAVNIPEGENNAILKHIMEVNDYSIVEGKVDKMDELDIEKRCRDYIQTCANNDEKPTVAGLALALGIRRETLVAWHNREISLPAKSQYVIDQYYSLLTAHMEQLMENGKINPIPAIFLMKNNMGYRDQNEVKVTADGIGEITGKRELREKYRNAIEVEAIDITDEIEEG